MNLQAKRRYDMLARVYAFGRDHARQFPEDTIGGRMFATVGKCVRDVIRHENAKPSGRKEARRATTPWLVARRGLRQRLQALRRTARALALDTAGFDRPFQLPRGNGDKHLLTVSRSFARHARKHRQPFIEHGLPPTFLNELAAGIEGFEQALRDRAAARAARIGGNASAKASLRAGFLAVRRLDAVVPNRLTGDPAALNAWRIARRVARPRPLLNRAESANPLPINTSAAVSDASLTDS